MNSVFSVLAQKRAAIYIDVLVTKIILLAIIMISAKFGQVQSQYLRIEANRTTQKAEKG